VCEVSRSCCEGMVASAAISMASGDGGSMVEAVVRGRRVMVVGRWPPREKVVRCSKRCPWRDFGSGLKC
jgi:hypothetical protein